MNPIDKPVVQYSHYINCYSIDTSIASDVIMINTHRHVSWHKLKALVQITKPPWYEVQNIGKVWKSGLNKSDKMVALIRGT